MIIRFAIFYLSFFCFIGFAIQHPTGFTTVMECVNNGATITYVLEEENGVKQFVLSLEKGIVVGEGGIVTNNGKILTDTETYKQDQQRLLQKDRDISKEQSIFFDGVLAIISSPGQQCYYHWLLQVIPRLKILSDSRLSYDKIYVYADNFKHHWQKDALYTVMDYLGISREKLLFVGKDFIVEAKKLLVPSVPWVPSKPDFWNSKLEWYRQFFKDVFVKEIKKISKHIFISRSKAQYRRISNEVALMDLLSKKGFVSYCLEDLSISEQASLFNNAEVIIGPHGAGWTNLIFCKQGTQIIEIDHGLRASEQRSAFKGMAARMGCFYYPFYSDFLEPTECPENILDPINQDITVDVEIFVKELDSILLDK